MRENDLNSYIKKKQNEAKAIESQIIQIQKQLELKSIQLSKDICLTR